MANWKLEILFFDENAATPANREGLVNLGIDDVLENGEGIRVLTFYARNTHVYHARLSNENSEFEYFDNMDFDEFIKSVNLAK